MEYDFNQVVNRLNTHSIKWDAYPPDVLPMWIADMDLQAPPVVMQALEKRLQHGIFGYECDYWELRQVFTQWAEEHYAWRISEEDIVIIPGVVTGLNLAVQSLGQPGDGLLIQTPVYPPFFEIAPHAGMVTVESPLTAYADGYYGIDLEKLESAITPQTRFLILCNPHNPVGRVFSKNELAAIAEVCVRKNLIIISDEIHCDFLFDDRHHTPIASLGQQIAERTITLMAPSKTFNIAGLKCSFMIIQDAHLRSKIANGKNGLVGCPSVLSLEAAWAAYAQGADWLRQVLSYLQANRDFLVSFIRQEIPRIKVFSPEATYLAWLDCRDFADKVNPCEYFLNEAKIAFNDGKAFGTGGEGFIRMNFGCPRTVLKQALERMKKAVLEHN